MIHPLLKNIDTPDFNDAESANDYGNLFINYANTPRWGIGTSVATSVCSGMPGAGKKVAQWTQGRF